MDDLIVVGSGGFAAEAIDYIQEETNFDIKIVSDSVEDIRPDLKKLHIGPLNSLKNNNIKKCFIGIGDPVIKKEIYNLICPDVDSFYTFVHKTAIISPTANIGQGCFLYPYTIIANKAHVGDHCTINGFSAVGHDSKLSDFSTLSAHVDITGNVVVEEGCFFGTGSRTSPGLKISEGTRIGAGVSVIRSSTKNQIILPNVAKSIKP